MEDEVMELDEELDEAEDAEEVEAIEDELEYDEDGNIVIPEEEETDESGTDEDIEDDGEDAEEEEDGSGDDAPTATATDDSAEVKALRAELAALKRQSADTLKRLGAKEQTDVMKGLAELAAEADGLTEDEYNRQREEEDRRRDAEYLLKQVEFERKAAADLVELKSAYPELATLSHVRDLPAEVRDKFARYRDLGLPAKDAYAAANPDGIRNNVATAVKRQKADNGKGHLRASTPKASGGPGVTMSRAELAEWREMFPGKSDKAIRKLYKETAEKE